MGETKGDLLTVKDAAAACSVSVRTMRTWIAKGEVQSELHPQGNKQIRLVLRSSLPLASPVTSPAITVQEGEKILHSEELHRALHSVAHLPEAVQEQGELIRQALAILERQEERAKRQDEALQRQGQEIQILRAELAAQQKRRPWWMFWK